MVTSEGSAIAMKDVLVFETHPAVRAGLVRRLEAENGLVVIQAFSDPERFAAAVQSLTPAFAIVGMFGPFGSNAANRAVAVATCTKVLAVTPYLAPEAVQGLDPRVIVVEDGPRGHRLAELVTGAP